MIDPQPGHFSLGDQLERPAVARFENFRILDTHADQIGDVEESPVIDLLTGDPPVGKPVPLAV